MAGERSTVWKRAELAPSGRLERGGPGDRIRRARLEADGAVLVASDRHAGNPARINDPMAIVPSGADGERLRGVFDDLANGSRIRMPLTPQPSGAHVGWLEDRFGIHWRIEIDGV